MISRRLLRIKAMHILYAYFRAEDKSINKFENELFYSIDKFYELYYYLLILINDVKDYFESRIELAKQKHIKTDEDLNPNTKFIDNRVIKLIENNDGLNRYIKEKKLNWNNNNELLKNLYNEIKNSKDYNEYMNNNDDSFSKDKNYIINIYKDIFQNSDLLYQILEDLSIYWNDDIEFVLSMIIQTLQRLNEGDNEYKFIRSLYKNNEDREFVKQLFRKTIINHEETKIIIEKNAKNWDAERIALIDFLIMEMAITEITEFSSIPINVSFNEYIEIVKFYSTRKSGVFINGILDKIIKELKKDNKIEKKGRGLLEKKEYNRL
ncbi:MAG: transcription antitermination protein NusB [Bacteroidales bacterium]|nr:transcription antitermination protein NusB [Bacteroidales bacterium]